MSIQLESILMLKHYYSSDYLNHLAKFTLSELKTFKVENLFINFFVKKGVYGNVVNSCPFYGSHGGFFSDNKFVKPDCEKVSLNELVAWLTQDDISSFTIIENPYCSNEEALKNIELIKMLKKNNVKNYELIKRYSYLKWMEDIKDSKELMDSYHTKTRNCVRKYLKSGAIIKNYNTNSNSFKNIISWIAMEHTKGIKVKNGLAKPLSYFESLRDNYQFDRFEVRVSYLDDKPIGGLLTFKIGNQIEYWTPVVTDLGKKVNSMYGLIHDTLHEIMSKKNSFLNFGGSWVSQNDLKRFKERFGSEVREYNYHCFVSSDTIKQKESNELLNAYPFFFIRSF